MKVHQLRFRQCLAVDIQQAWEFFSNPANLATLTPPWLDFQVTCDLPAVIYPGMIITYRIRPFLGLPMTWVTEITQAQGPNYFVDEQRSGPYRLWHHEHHFRSIPSGVEMIDQVSYALFWGRLSSLAHDYIVLPRLNEIFRFRCLKMVELFGNP